MAFLSTLFSQIINGLQSGSIYALVALGYSMVYGIIMLLNFAHGDIMNRPRLCRQHKKPRVQEYSVLAGVAQRQRRHSCFCLDAFVVVKVDVTVNHLFGFRKGRRFVAVDAFCFENGEEIFRHCIVIRVPTS